MRTAQQVFAEFLQHIDPPPGCAVVLTEGNPEPAGALNWIVTIGSSIDVLGMLRYDQKITELRASDPVIDWSAEQMPVQGKRQIARGMRAID